MEILRQIIKEELRKALLEVSDIRESMVQSPSEDEIIYNFEAGRAFGINSIAKDINGLGEYYMSDYFPRSEMEEGWMFEIEASYGGSQLIEITHRLTEDYKSYWKLDISEVEIGSDQPQIVATSKFVNNYRNFIEVVNSTMEKKINPNLL